MPAPPFEILHHGAVRGVTGSCHELRLVGSTVGSTSVEHSAARSTEVEPTAEPTAVSGILVDCGLFQGAETSGEGADRDNLGIDFPIGHIRALVVTHVHIDHVGRVPYLLAAGFEGPIYCSLPSAILLPLVIEDALAVGATRDRKLVARTLERLKSQIRPLAYGKWARVDTGIGTGLEIRLQRAGHILGSAYVECRITAPPVGSALAERNSIGDLMSD